MQDILVCVCVCGWLPRSNAYAERRGRDRIYLTHRLLYWISWNRIKTKYESKQDVIKICRNEKKKQDKTNKIHRYNRLVHLLSVCLVYLLKRWKNRCGEHHRQDMHIWFMWSRCHARDYLHFHFVKYRCNLSVFIGACLPICIFSINLTFVDTFTMS